MPGGGPILNGLRSIPGEDGPALLLLEVGGHGDLSAGGMTSRSKYSVMSGCRGVGRRHELWIGRGVRVGSAKSAKRCPPPAWRGGAGRATVMVDTQRGVYKARRASQSRQEMGGSKSEATAAMARVMTDGQVLLSWIARDRLGRALGTDCYRGLGVQCVYMIAAEIFGRPSGGHACQRGAEPSLKDGRTTRRVRARLE